jgi:hypothetical protein
VSPEPSLRNAGVIFSAGSATCGLSFLILRSFQVLI